MPNVYQEAMVPQPLHDLFDILASAFGDGWLLVFTALLVSLSRKAARPLASQIKRIIYLKKIPIAP